MSDADKNLKFAIYGAGAIGLDLAARLIGAGHHVTIIARGQTLEALQTSGFVYQTANSKKVVTPDSFALHSDPLAAGQQDYVFLTTKVTTLLEIAPNLPPLFAAHTAVVSLTNGIPPWYSYLQDRTIGRFDFTRVPVQTFLKYVEPERIIGGTAGRSVDRDGPTPLVISHTSGDGHRIGELDHSESQRTKSLARILTRAGINTEISNNIHRDIWCKLLGNICVNPLSVLTRKTIGEMLADPATRSRMEVLVQEAETVGIKIGVIEKGDFQLESFFAYAENHLNQHETSMLQDFKSGRHLETGRITEVIVMLAELQGVEVAVPEIKKVSLSVSEAINRNRNRVLEQEINRGL